MAEADAIVPGLKDPGTPDADHRPHPTDEMDGAGNATVVLRAATFLSEGQGTSGPITLTLANVSTAAGTVTMRYDVSSQAQNGSDVGVASYTSSFSVAQVPARDYVIELPAIAIIDDALRESDEILSVRVQVTGQMFANGTDTEVFNIVVADNDTMPGYRITLPDGFQGQIGSSGSVIATAGFQDITIYDLPGTVDLDASFNRGGDVIRLSGLAADWHVYRSGSTARLTDGDTSVIIPVGTQGSSVVFEDGARSLRFDDASGTMMLSGQSISAQSATITAQTDVATLPGEADPDASGRLVLAESGNVTLKGKVSIIGTAGHEQVGVVGGSVQLDPSFNAGGDIVSIGVAASQVTARLVGSTVLLAHDDFDISVPVGTQGTTLDFVDVDGTLFFDVTAAGVFIGNQLITAMPAPLAAIA